MALELARENRAYEDVASKFFEHFVAITDAMNTLDGTGLWELLYSESTSLGRNSPPQK